MPASVFILIPAYNAERYIGSAITSVRDQTYSDWQLLVLDDASTDATYDNALAQARVDERITVIRNSINLGMVANWNHGISFCKSPFFVKLDADDIWHPKMLEQAMAVLSIEKDVALVFSKYVKIDDNGDFIPGTSIELPEFAKGKAFSCVPIVKEGPDKMLSYSILRQGLSVMRFSVFNSIGGYESFQSADTIFYFKVGCQFKIFCIDEVLYFYRTHSQSDSARIDRMGTRPRLLFEIKNFIIRYYYRQGKLTFLFFLKSLRKVKFDFMNFEAVSSRQAKRWFRSAVLTVMLLLIYPDLFTLFFIRRVKEKMTTI